jgi:hypothetical protein
MSVSLSQRRAKFYRLVRAANDQTTEWLIAHLRDSRLTDTPDHRRVTRLSRLACLRVLACRDGSGQSYPARKRFVRERLATALELPLYEAAATQLQSGALSMDGDLGCTTEELEAKYGTEHPAYQMADWQAEVAAGDTKLGYWIWAMHSVESHCFDQSATEPGTSCHRSDRKVHPASDAQPDVQGPRIVVFAGGGVVRSVATQGMAEPPACVVVDYDDCSNTTEAGIRAFEQERIGQDRDGFDASGAKYIY